MAQAFEIAAADAPALFDAEAIAGELAQLAASHPGRERELRAAVAQRLKAALAASRTEIERLLLQDRHGGRCAARLCWVQDEIIHVLYGFAVKHLYPTENTSKAERMAIVATGGYGRGLMAPGSDIDLLFVLPYKQTAWGESIAEAILYCLWDMGLKVGHATRSIDECIRQAKGDMTIRTAILEARFLLGDRALYDELLRAVRQAGGSGHRGRIRRRQARRARGAPSPQRPVALSGRAQRQGRQGRPARPAHPVLDRQIRLPRPQAGGTDRAGRVRPRRIRGCSSAATISCGRCAATCTSSPAAPRNGCRSTSSAASPSGSAIRSAPGLRDVERFMKHYFLIAKDVGDLTAILCAALEEPAGEARSACSTAWSPSCARRAGACCARATISSSTTAASTSPMPTSSRAIPSTSSACSASPSAMASPSTPRRCAWRPTRSS